MNWQRRQRAIKLICSFIIFWAGIRIGIVIGIGLKGKKVLLNIWFEEPIRQGFIPGRERDNDIR